MKKVHSKQPASGRAVLESNKHTFDITGIEVVEHMLNEMRRLKYHETTTVGLYAIDRHPSEVSKRWIEENAFRITPPDSAPEFVD